MAGGRASTRQSETKAPTVTVHVPMRFQRRSGRKAFVSHDEAQPRPTPDQRPDPVLAALARAFYWRRLIESGAYATVNEIAVAERINDSYAGRVLRLTLLAPSVVKAILDGRQSVGLPLETLMRPLPPEWDIQQETFKFITRRS